MSKPTALTILLFLLISLLALNPTGAALGDWPMYRYNPAHTGATNSSGPTSMVSEVWSTGPMGTYTTSPAIVSGIIYMTGYNLIALNASTGKILWQQNEQGPASPVVENGVVYTSHGAFNATTGTQLWSVKGGSSIAVADGIYYTEIYANENSSYAVTAFNASTKEKLWDYEENGGISGIAIKNGAIFFGTWNQFFALNAYTGSKMWVTQMGTIPQSSPAVSDGYVYFSGKDADTHFNSFYCLDVLTGREVWHSTVNTGSSPAVAHGLVYVGSLDGQLSGFNATTGSKVWNCTVTSLPAGYGIKSSVVVAGDAVYVGADDGYLHAFNASNGVKLWSYKVGDMQDLQGSPIVVDGRIYMGSESNYLIALETSPITPTNTPPFLSLENIVSLAVLIGVIAIILLLKRRHNVKLK